MLAERLNLSMDPRSIIESHQAGIWRYLRYLGCDASEAEDLAQETFLVVLRGADLPPEGPRRAAFLRTIARNLFYKSRRRALAPLEELEKADGAWEDFARNDGGSSQLQALRDCVGSLDGRAKEAVHLRYERRSSHAAMAASLAMGEEGVKTLLRRVKERLRDCVKRKLGHDGA
jgi:RNA polymerase sigma-70 factor (ECF subfamily)